MEEIIKLIVTRQEELKLDLKRITGLSLDPKHHSLRINDALKDSIEKIDLEESGIVAQLIGLLNQVPSFIESGFNELENAKRGVAERFNELEKLKSALLEKEERDKEKEETQHQLLEKIKLGEVTEETIAGPRTAGTRPESLSAYRKLAEKHIKTEG